MHFTKPARTWDEQVELLRSRGLHIPDREKARHYLSHINYYRLTGYLDASHATDLTFHTRHLAKLQEEISRSDEIFIHHYRNTYRHPTSPPVWVLSEIMSLGVLSRWITHMVPADRAVLARVYGLDQGVLKGFVRHLTYVRNLCAHHSRVWNRRLTVTMPLPRRKPAGLVSSFNPNQTRHVYNTLVMLAAMMDLGCPGHLWRTRLQRVIKEHRVNVQLMGFPKDWQQRPVWAESQKDTE